MTENKRFMYFEHKGADYILDNPNTELDFIEMLGDCLEAEEIVDLLNNQDDKIRELQERNDRQRKTIDDLYQLILNRDYTGQEELIKELEESEQLLREEMKLYCR